MGMRETMPVALRSAIAFGEYAERGRSGRLYPVSFGPCECHDGSEDHVTVTDTDSGVTVCSIGCGCERRTVTESEMRALAGDR